MVEVVETPLIPEPIVEDVTHEDELEDGEETEELNKEVILPPPMIRGRPRRENRKQTSMYNPSTGQSYTEGVINLNTKGQEILSMTETETLEHVFGIAMMQQY